MEKNHHKKSSFLSDHPWEELHHLRRDSRDSRDSRNSSTKDGWMRMENPCQISKIGVFNDDLQIGGE